MRKNINIGTSSLVLIFIVLCLATFGLLSLSNARGDWNLAVKHADAVQNYYEADYQGEVFVQMIRQMLAEMEEQTQTEEEQAVYLEHRLGAYYSRENQTVQTDIEMNYGQALRIELDITTPGTIQIRCWNVYNKEEYEIDDSMPVWTGTVTGKNMREGSDRG